VNENQKAYNYITNIYLNISTEYFNYKASTIYAINALAISKRLEIQMRRTFNVKIETLFPSENI